MKKKEYRRQETVDRRQTPWLIGCLAIAIVLGMAGFSMDRLERNRAGLGDSSTGEVIKAPKPAAPKALLNSRWDWEQWRGGRLFDSWTEHNVVTNEGLTALLGVMFKGWSQVGSWYVLIYESDSTPSGATTYAVPGITECAAYDETTRPAWTPNSGTTNTVTNSAAKASFTFNASKTVYGAALVSGVTKEDVTSGLTMYNMSNFSSSKSVADDDVLKVTITLTAADS